MLFGDQLSTLEARRVVVVDESSTHLGMTPRYARAPRGERAYADTLRNYGQNVSLIAGLRLDGMVAPFVVEGAINTAVFETYVREILCPTLRRGDIVMLDNLRCHKAHVIQALIEASGASLLFLPPYSPDLSPIEKAFSKLKTFVRRAKALTLDALMDALAQALAMVTLSDALGWFSSCGFLNLDHPT